MSETMDLRDFNLVSLGLLLIALLGAGVTRGQELSTSEYHVEAAFLYHFANFVSWPPEAFPTENSPIRIGILGEDPFGQDLENTIKDKMINGRGLEVVRLDFKQVSQARHCQIVFISSSERKRLSDIIETLKGSSVLTVGRMERFTQAGGMINFVLEDKKVRFEINGEAAKQAGLKISAKLLNLARNKGVT